MTNLGRLKLATIPFTVLLQKSLYTVMLRICNIISFPVLCLSYGSLK